MSKVPRAYEAVGITHNLVHAVKCLNGEESGWYLEIGLTGAWVSDADADRLARLLLFEGDDK